MRRFYLDRQQDMSGVSGTGRVAEGVEFSDGSCCFKWLTGIPGLSYHRSMQDVEEIHGHEGATVIVYVDEYDPSAVTEAVPNGVA